MKEQLKSHRKKLGLTQQDFAKSIGLKSRCQINRYEKGHCDVPQWIIILLNLTLE